jgi:hypothetical protein
VAADRVHEKGWQMTAIVRAFPIANKSQKLVEAAVLDGHPDTPATHKYATVCSVADFFLFEDTRIATLLSAECSIQERDHIKALAQRKAELLEQLYSTAVALESIHKQQTQLVNHLF